MGTLITFVTFFYGLAVLTYGMALPTGAFVPSILCGAAYGRLVRGGPLAAAPLRPVHVRLCDCATVRLCGGGSAH